MRIGNDRVRHFYPFAPIIKYCVPGTLKRKTKALEKAIKTNLSTLLLPNENYQLFHHDSKSNLYIQAVDYCSWAIYKKWETLGNEQRPYNKIKERISSEFNYFEKGVTYFY